MIRMVEAFLQTHGRKAAIAATLMILGCASAGAAPVLNATNGHWYEAVQADVTWEAARAAASAASYDPDGVGGTDPLRGYLVTITSASEDDFVRTSIGLGTAPYWIGASDAESEGLWRWVTGPEAGALFWENGPGSVPGAYANWGAVDQPDDFAGGEDWAVTNWAGFGYAWNDYGAGGVGSSYVIEYSLASRTVPEPATLLLVCTAIAALARRGRSR